MNIMKLLSIILSMIMATSAIAVESAEAQKTVEHKQEKTESDLSLADVFYGISCALTLATSEFLFYLYRNYPQSPSFDTSVAQQAQTLPTLGLPQYHVLGVTQSSMAENMGRGHVSYQRSLKDHKSMIIKVLCALAVSLPGTLRGAYKLYKNLPQKLLKQSA